MKDKIIRIKRSRMKPEELFLIDIFNDMTIFEQNRFPYIVFWVKDGETLFKQNINDGMLSVNYYKIWSVLSSDYDMYFTDIGQFIKYMVEKHMNWYGIKPSYFHAQITEREIYK